VARRRGSVLAFLFALVVLLVIPTASRADVIGKCACNAEKLPNHQPHQGQEPHGAPCPVPHEAGRSRSCVEGSSTKMVQAERRTDFVRTVAGLRGLGRRTAPASVQYA
jgi:hypothetical protein